MTTYKGKANPNATNSELDAKIIITHKRHDLGKDDVKYDDETSPLVDSILDKLEENTIINMRLKEAN